MIIITLFKLLKIYQFVKNKLVLIHEQIIKIFLELRKTDNKDKNTIKSLTIKIELFKYYLKR